MPTPRHSDRWGRRGPRVPPLRVLVAARHGHVNPSSPFPCDGHARSVDQRRQVLGVHGLGRRGRRWSVAPGTHAARLTRRWTTPRRRCCVRAVGSRSAAAGPDTARRASRGGYGPERQRVCFREQKWPVSPAGHSTAPLVRPRTSGVQPKRARQRAARHGSRQATPPCTSAWPHQGSSPVDDPMSTTWTRISLPPVTSAAGWMDARSKDAVPCSGWGHRRVLDTCGMCTGPADRQLAQRRE